MLLVAVLMVAACSENNEVNRGQAVTVVLTAVNARNIEGDPKYQLTVPNNFLRSRVTTDNLEVRCIYPSMQGFSVDLRGEFYKDTGGRTEKVVRIFITYFQDEWSYKNDSGEQFYRNLILANPKAFSLIEQSDESAGGTLMRYARVNFESPAVDIIQFADGRLSALSCDVTKCKGRTTWNRKLAVMYYISSSLRSEFSAIDQKVVELVESFNPKERRSN
jgi:hypothetical protein